MALTELVDASLLEFSADYAPLSAIQEPKWRVRALLTKLDSDRKHGTDFGNKFVAKVGELFSSLPKPKEWQAFHNHDLPLLFVVGQVWQFALEHRLNKSQTKAIDALQKAAPDVFKAIAQSTPQQAIQQRSNPYGVRACAEKTKSETTVLNTDVRRPRVCGKDRENTAESGSYLYAPPAGLLRKARVLRVFQPAYANTGSAQLGLRPQRQTADR